MTPQSKHWSDRDERVDVVVIGSGGAGLFAAIEAAEAGATVVVLEREPEVGGSTRLAGGYVALCETDLQPGTKGELLADLMESHHFDCDERLSQLYVDLAADSYLRLKELGIVFAGVQFFAHMTKPWAHVLATGSLGGGAQIVDGLHRAANAAGAEIRCLHRARRLIREEGRVVAVEIEHDGAMHRIHASRGVVVATGGFTRNPELVKNYGRPGTERIVPITGSGSFGEGLIMALEHGAGTSYIGCGVAPTGPVEPTTAEGNLTCYAGGVIVNKEGRRFVDESSSYLDISWAGLRQTDVTMVQIYDSEIQRAYRSTMLGQVITGGATFSADTLEQLHDDVSAACGLDAAEALASVQRYNRAVETGVDEEFGRRHLLGESGALVRIEHPPYIAAVTVPGTTHFNGGLRIDEDMRVRDVWGATIPGLYAAGEVTGGFHGSGYLSATFIGMALLFGRVAGRSAAAMT